jgi:hypothetical protein
MTSNLKAVQNGHHSSSIFLVWVKEILRRSQLGGTDLHCSGEVALGKYRVTGCGCSDCPRALAAYRILDERCYCGVAELRAATSGPSGHATDLVFTRLGNDVNIFQQ